MYPLLITMCTAFLDGVQACLFFSMFFFNALKRFRIEVSFRACWHGFTRVGDLFHLVRVPARHIAACSVRHMKLHSTVLSWFGHVRTLCLLQIQPIGLFAFEFSPSRFPIVLVTYLYCHDFGNVRSASRTATPCLRRPQVVPLSFA